MKNRLITAAIISLMLTGSALAADKPGTKTDGDDNFKTNKELIIKHLDARIEMLQREKACVEAAKTDEDINACREKFREERKEILDKMKKGKNKAESGK